MPNDQITITISREELERLIDILNTRFYLDTDVRYLLRKLTKGTNYDHKTISGIPKTI